MVDVVSKSWTALEQARLALARFPRREEDLACGLTRLAELGRRYVGVERVSIWDLDRAGGRLLLRAVADDRDHHVEELSVPNLGAYAEALATHPAIAIPDVTTSPLTRSLLDPYCRPLGIVSMLDVPVYAGGEVIGIVCHESRARRVWNEVDAELGLCVAQVASSLRTEQAAREAEEAVRRSEARLAEVVRRAAIGRLARGYAHDLKNLLAVVLSSTELLERRGEDPAVRADVVATLSDIVKTAQRLCDELGDATPMAGPSEPIELDRAIREMEGSMAALAGADRRLSFTVNAPGARVAMTSGALEQILINLVVNAREATSADQRIEVATRLPTADGEGATAVIEVRDSGQGLDERTRTQIFEPYFSTKGPQRGIGLSTVQRLVEAGGGWIDVESEPGGGATFRVHVPLVH